MEVAETSENVIFHTRLYAGRGHTKGRSYFYNLHERKKCTILKSSSSPSKILTVLPKTWILPCSEHGGSNSKRHFDSSTVNIHIVPGDCTATVHFFTRQMLHQNKVQRVQHHLKLRSKKYKSMHPMLFQFTT